MTSCTFSNPTLTPTAEAPMTDAGVSVSDTPLVYADSVFSGYAYLDANLNGQLDDKDTPLEGATFYVEINGVKAFGETTDKNGYAFILIPSNVDYPVILSMEAPRDSNLKLIGDPEIIHNQTDSAPKFLFSSK